MFDFRLFDIYNEVKTIAPESKKVNPQTGEATDYWFQKFKWAIYPILSCYAWFKVYIYGTTYDRWGNSTSYGLGDFVVYTDFKVYMCIYPNTGNVPGSPALAPGGGRYWALVSDSHIGFIDRLKYTPCKREFEYILNQKFGLSWDDSIEQNPIWIEDNSDPSEQFWIGFSEDSSSYIEYSDVAASKYISFGTELDINSAVINYPLLIFDTPDKVEILKAFANKIIFRSLTATYTGY